MPHIKMSFSNQIGKYPALSLTYPYFFVKIVAIHESEAVQKVSYG